MNFSANLRDLRALLDRNSPVILTGMAVSGAFLTTYFTFKGTRKSDYQIQEEIDNRLAQPGASINTIAPISKVEEISLTWKNYVPAAATLAGTSACMVMATKIGLDRTAAMAGALVVSERTYDQYKEKVKETLGENKHVKVVDAVATDQVQATTNPNSMIILGDGEQWCFDSWSGRFFKNTMEGLKQAVNDFNHELLYGDYCSLTEFYTRIGLDEIQESDQIGWRADKGLLEVAYTSVLKDGKPCIVITFDRPPMPNFR